MSLATLQISTKILSDIPGTHFLKFIQLFFEENTDKKEILFLFEANFMSFLILLLNQLFIAQLM